MKRTSQPWTFARTIAALVLGSGLCACGSNEGPGLLPSEDVQLCRDSCDAHATPTCTTRCESSCSGPCGGSMKGSDFPYVDSIDCSGSAIVFHEGGSELTCYP